MQIIKGIAIAAVLIIAGLLALIVDATERRIKKMSDKREADKET